VAGLSSVRKPGSPFEGRKASTTKDTKVHEGKPWAQIFVVLPVFCGF